MSSHGNSGGGMKKINFDSLFEWLDEEPIKYDPCDRASRNIMKMMKKGGGSTSVPPASLSGRNTQQLESTKNETASLPTGLSGNNKQEESDSHTIREKSVAISPSVQTYGKGEI